MLSLVLNGSAAEQTRLAPASITFACHVSGGGYAIKDPTGRVLENGDGVPFSPPLRAILRVVARPPHLVVTDGALPHPDCAEAPTLDSFTPVLFTWCTAHYEVRPTTPGDYLLRSTSRSTLMDGSQKGNIMEAFLIGGCVPTDATRLQH